MSKAIYDELIEAGAPPAPKGTFYRIDVREGAHLFRISLMRRRRIFHEEIVHDEVWIGDAKVYGAVPSVVLAIERLHKRWSDQESLLRLNGDHP